jgi:hypothetical protein
MQNQKYAYALGTEKTSICTFWMPSYMEKPSWILSHNSGKKLYAKRKNTLKLNCKLWMWFGTYQHKMFDRSLICWASSIFVMFSKLICWANSIFVIKKFSKLNITEEKLSRYLSCNFSYKEKWLLENRREIYLSI